MKIKTLFGLNKCPECGQRYDKCLSRCPKCHHENESRPERCVKSNFPYLSWPTELFLFAIGYVGLVFVSTIVALLTSGVEDITLQLMLNNGISYLIIFLGIGVFLFINRDNFFSYFKSWQPYAYGVVIFIVMFGLSLILSALLSLIQPVDPGTNQSVVELMVKNYPVISIVLLAVIGPIVEELAYRVGLFSLLSRFNKVFAYVLTILIFSLMHIDFMAEDIVNELLNLPSYLLGAVVLTVSYDIKGPACSIFVHILNNLLSCILILVNVGS